MKRILLSLAVIAMSMTALAQQAKEEFKKNVCLSASNYLAYPGPTQMALTAAPDGYEPFYISHYGRHGSRYLIGDNDYKWPLKVFREQNEKGNLTAKGKQVLEKLQMLYNESYKRYGELTLLGAQQHKGIAKRMVERFPEVFAGETNIDAKSTIVIRCILSMENELQQMLLMNPKLNITHDASEHDMCYMNYDDKPLRKHRHDGGTDKLYKDWCKKNLDPTDFIKRLFIKYNAKDEDFGDKQARDMYYTLFKLASNLQSSELRKQITLYDIFTEDDVYKNWTQENIWWYLNYGPAPHNGATQPFTQRYLLKNIIEQADSCIQLAHPGATLRFGHETMVMPLTCLLGLNGADKQISDINRIEKEGWINYKIFPMACNIQFIFYKQKGASKPTDGDILVKVLLNENEAKLPSAITPVSAPYYKWSDVRQYYLNKIASYKE